MARDAFCEKYGINVFSTALKTIPDVVEFVDKNPFTLGVIPVENSIDGTLRASLDSLIVTQNPNIKIELLNTIRFTNLYYNIVLFYKSIFNKSYKNF